MSTRCQIGFYESDNLCLLKPNALLYRHSDGNPESVVPDLVPFLKLFQERRGLNDVEYAAAWTLHHLISQHVEYMVELAKDDPRESRFSPKDGKNCIGFGICEGFHGDIEYYYAIRGAELKVYQVTDTDSVDDFKLVKTISLKE